MASYARGGGQRGIGAKVEMAALFGRKSQDFRKTQIIIESLEGVSAMLSMSMSEAEAGGREGFLKRVQQEVELFGETALVTKALAGRVTMEDYHCILNRIYHQSKTSPLTFALAAVSCQNKYWTLQSYLLHHAEEEKTHWQWTLSDLKGTGFSGLSPDLTYPDTVTSAYIAFNYYVSTYMPVARLGIAMMLETLGANYGRRIAESLMKSLSLKPNQVVFAYGHGDTDVEHSEEMMKVLDQAQLSDADWRDMIYAAKTAGALYRQMYTDRFL
jgi:hypothetical protein